jgi:hypothetical protein
VDFDALPPFTLIRSRPSAVGAQRLRARKMCKRTVRLGVGSPLVLALLIHGFVDQTHEFVASPMSSARTAPGRTLAPPVASV